MRETFGTNTIIPIYDNEDSVCGIVYNGTTYYFVKNLQGDVISITNAGGTTLARYSYDAWGKCTIAEDTTEEGIATINPYRYRTYYYDTETGLYYLQSRYYDPETGRFINGDEATYLAIFDNVLNTNLFTYCENNPVNMVDNDGTISISIPRSAVAFFLDIVFSSIPVIGAMFAPIKTIAKAFGKAALKVKARTPLAKFIQAVIKNAKKVIEVFVKVVDKIPIIGKAISKTLKKHTNKLLTMIAGATASMIFNKVLNALLLNVDLILSLGGAISGIVDCLFDKKLDGKIKIKI